MKGKPDSMTDEQYELVCNIRLALIRGLLDVDPEKIWKLMELEAVRAHEHIVYCPNCGEKFEVEE